MLIFKKTSDSSFVFIKNIYTQNIFTKNEMQNANIAFSYKLLQTRFRK